MIKNKTFRVLLIPFIIVSLFMITPSNTKANDLTETINSAISTLNDYSNQELTDFENMALFVRYAKARINLCHFTGTSSRPKIAKEYHKLFGEGEFEPKKTPSDFAVFCRDQKNQKKFKNRLKLLYGLHIYGELYDLKEHDTKASADIGSKSVFGLFNSKIYTPEHLLPSELDSTSELLNQSLDNIHYSKIKLKPNDFKIFNRTVSALSNKFGHNAVKKADLNERIEKVIDFIMNNNTKDALDKAVIDKIEDLKQNPDKYSKEETEKIEQVIKDYINSNPKLKKKLTESKQKKETKTDSKTIISIPTNPMVDIDLYFGFYNPNFLTEYLINSCNSRSKCDKNDPNIEACYCRNLVAENGINYLLDENINTPEFLQQMFWNGHKNYTTDFYTKISQAVHQYHKYQPSNSIPFVPDNLVSGIDDDLPLSKAILEGKFVAPDNWPYYRKFIKFTPKEVTKMQKIIRLNGNYQNDLTQIDFNLSIDLYEQQRRVIDGGLGFILNELTRFGVKVASNGQQFQIGIIKWEGLKLKDEKIKQIWQNFRTISNILLLLAFLMIVLSQLTNFGLSNYDAKKMLPKLLVSIVLINLSYFLILMTIDLSNILTDGINGFLSANAEQMVGSSLSEASFISALKTVVFLAASVILFIISFILAIINLLFVFILGSIRAMLFILTIVLSPISFASNIFPNFKRFYKLWWNLLKTALLITPTLALINGFSLLIYAIITPDNPITGTIILFGISNFGIFYLLANLKKSLLIASIPMAGKVLSSSAITLPSFAWNKFIKPTYGDQVINRLKEKQDQKIINKKGSKYARLRSKIENERMQNQKSESVNFNNTADIETILDQINPNESKLSKQSITSLSAGGNSNISRDIQNRDSSLNFMMKALYGYSTSSDGQQVDFDHQKFLKAMAKAKQLGASEAELKSVFFHTLGNLEQQNNLPAMAELSYNYGHHNQELGNYSEQDYQGEENQQQRRNEFGKIFKQYPIVSLNDDRKVKQAINHRMLTKSEDHLPIITSLAEENPQLKTSIQDRIPFLDQESQEAFAKYGLYDHETERRQNEQTEETI